MKKNLIAVLIVLLLLSVSLFAFTACDDKADVIETRFAFDIDEGQTSVWGIDGSLLKAALDIGRSGITLRSDGAMQLDLILNGTGLKSLLKTFRKTVEDVLSDLDIASFSASYVDPIMPGFDFDDIEGSLALAEKSLGVAFIADNAAERDAFVQVLKEVLTTGQLPEEIDIPDGFGLRLTSSYYVKDVTYPDGTVYKGVYLTPTDPDTQPYVVFDLTEDEAGVHSLNLKVDFIKLNLVAHEVTA